MRETVLAMALAMVGSAGCHQTCNCAGFESCQPATLTCTVNPDARFDFVAVDGHVDDSGRSLSDGLPNPQVCVTLAGGSQCAAVQVVSYSPSWHQTLFAAVDGTALLAAPIAVTYTDKGLFHDVDICHGTVSLIESYLHDGGFRFNCANGSYVHFALQNVARGTAIGDGGASD